MVIVFAGIKLPKDPSFVKYSSNRGRERIAKTDAKIVLDGVVQMGESSSKFSQQGQKRTASVVGVK
jgi:hypothetical protein